MIISYIFDMKIICAQLSYSGGIAPTIS